MNTSAANRPLSLAATFRDVADLLRANKMLYDWNRPHQCNCGLVARHILGFSSDEMLAQFRASFPIQNGPGLATWATAADRACPITGISMDSIFRKLTEAGMQFSDFAELERMSNPDVIARVDSNKYTTTKTEKRWMRKPKEITAPLAHKFDDRLSLVAYLWSWAELIEEHHEAIQPSEATLEATELRPLVKA